MRMKVAYHLLNFAVWTDKTEDMKIEAIKRVGYKAVESIEIDYTNDPVVLKDRLDKLEVKLSAMNFPGLIMGTDDDTLTSYAKNTVKLGKCISCDASIIMVPRTDGKNIHSYGTTLDHYQEAARRLNLVGHILADGGIKLCIHNHIDHMTESIEEMDILMNETNEKSVGICFDTAHAICGGNDPLIYAKRFKSRILHLHLKDTKNMLSGRPYFFKNVFLPLGEGVIDFPAILTILKGVNYNGWYTVELDASFSSGDPEKEASISFAYLKKIFKLELENIMGH